MERFQRFKRLKRKKWEEVTKKSSDSSGKMKMKFLVKFKGDEQIFCTGNKNFERS